MSQVGDRFALAVEHAEGERTVSVHGEIDLSTAPALESTVREAASDGSAVAIDLSNVTFLDSAGLAVLIRGHESARGQFCLRQPSSQVLQVLDVTGVGAIIPVDP